MDGQKSCCGGISRDTAGERYEPALDGMSVDVDMRHPSSPGMMEYYPRQILSALYPYVKITAGRAPVDIDDLAVDAFAPEFPLSQRHMDRYSPVRRGIRTDHEYFHRSFHIDGVILV